jgi:protease I
MSLSLIVFAQPEGASATKPLDGIHGIILLAEAYDSGEMTTIRDFLIQYGTEIDIVGPTTTVYGEYGSSVDTDFLIGDLTNISDYDFVFVPGGGSPANLIEIPAALALVVDAYNAGLVLAAICHGPWVFAEADIIAGRNISGNIGIQTYIINANANFIPDGIVIDGPFVTADVTYMHDFAQQGILKGLGLFESDPPEIHKLTLDVDSTEEIGSISIIVEVSDAFDTKVVIAQLYKFNIDTQEYVLSRQAQLSRNENNTIYSNIIEALLPGNYSLDIKVEDVLGNIGIYEDVF